MYLLHLYMCSTNILGAQWMKTREEEFLLPVFLSSILSIFCYAGLDWYALHTIILACHDEDLILVS